MPSRRSTLKERFETKFRVTPGCWLWTAYTDAAGYGKFKGSNGQGYAHRASYEMYVGPIPKGMALLHSCDNPTCVNPDHLRSGTLAENNADCKDKGRQARGAGHGMARLCPADVKTIRALLASGQVQESIAGIFGVSQVQISRIKLSKSWGHLV